VLALLASCGRPDSSANTIYVKAAAKVANAAVAFNKAEYEKSLDLCVEARFDVEKILTDYQGTSIALDIVKNADTRIGPCSYADLCSKIIPTLEKLSAAEFEKVRPALACALGNHDPLKRDEALAKLAMLAIYFDAQSAKLSEDGFKPKVSLSDEETARMINACIAEISQIGFKNSVAAIRGAHSANAKASATAAPSVPSKPEPFKPAVIADKEKFLKKARADANMISYDIKSAEILFESSAKARGQDKAFADEYSAIIASAFEKASQINSANLKASAQAQVAVAAANAGLCDAAIKFSDAIKDEPLKESVLSFTAESLSKEGNHTYAIAVISRLPDGPAKEKFLSRAVLAMAKSGMTKEAAEVAGLFKSAGLKSSALVSIACLSQGKDQASIVALLKNVDVHTLTADAVTMLSRAIAPVTYPYTTQEAWHAARLAAIARKIARLDSATARVWNDAATDAMTKLANGKDAAALLKPLCENLIMAGNPESAYALAQKFAFKNADDNSFNALCEIALELALSNNAGLSVKVFDIASSICSSIEATKAQNAVFLAWQVSLAGLDDDDCVKILNPFLPKF